MRCSELLALKPNDVDFKADTIRVDESSDQRNKGKIGPCKNVAAYRTILNGRTKTLSYHHSRCGRGSGAQSCPTKLKST
jgi:integrase